MILWAFVRGLFVTSAAVSLEDAVYGRARAVQPPQCPIRDRPRLAPSGLPVLLALAVATPFSRPRDRRRDPDSDPPHGSRQPTWGRRRIQAELALLGCAVSNRTVAQHMGRTSPQLSPTWRTFLETHRRESRDFREWPFYVSFAPRQNRGYRGDTPGTLAWCLTWVREGTWAPESRSLCPGPIIHLSSMRHASRLRALLPACAKRINSSWTGTDTRRLGQLMQAIHRETIYARFLISVAGTSSRRRAPR